MMRHYSAVHNSRSSWPIYYSLHIRPVQPNFDLTAISFLIVQFGFQWRAKMDIFQHVQTLWSGMLGIGNRQAYRMFQTLQALLCGHFLAGNVHALGIQETLRDPGNFNGPRHVQ